MTKWRRWGIIRSAGGVTARPAPHFTPYTLQAMETKVFTNCTYTEEWRGEYPYSSSCTATVESEGKVIAKFHFATCINCKGETDAEWCRRWARDYIPRTYTLQEVIRFWEERGYAVVALEATLAKAVSRIEGYMFERSRPYSWLTGRCRREAWRKIYEERRVHKRLLQSPAHLLHRELSGTNYLEKPL